MKCCTLLYAEYEESKQTAVKVIQSTVYKQCNLYIVAKLSRLFGFFAPQLWRHVSALELQHYPCCFLWEQASLWGAGTDKRLLVTFCRFNKQLFSVFLKKPANILLHFIGKIIN